MIDAVLATDMAVHFELLKSFNSHMEATPDVRQWQVRPGCGPAPHPLGQGCAPRVCARLMGEAGLGCTMAALHPCLIKATRTPLYRGVVERRSESCSAQGAPPQRRAPTHASPTPARPPSHRPQLDCPLPLPSPPTPPPTPPTP